MTDTTRSLAALDDRLDRLVNIDLGQHGLEHLHAAARSKLGCSLAGAAADLLHPIALGDTVLLTSGPVTRCWISPYIGENERPAGLAGRRSSPMVCQAHLIVVAEDTLHAPLAAILGAAGLTALPLEQARNASTEGSLAAVTLQSFTTVTEAAPAAAAVLLDALAATLLFSTERIGRNADSIYCNMGPRQWHRPGADFDEALRRGIPTVAAGDDGNEIGMRLGRFPPLSGSVKSATARALVPESVWTCCG